MPRSQKRRANEAKMQRMMTGVLAVNELQAHAKETNRQLMYLSHSNSFYLLDAKSPESVEQFLQLCKEKDVSD